MDFANNEIGFGHIPKDCKWNKEGVILELELPKMDLMSRFKDVDTNSLKPLISNVKKIGLDRSIQPEKLVNRPIIWSEIYSKLENE